MHEFTINSEAYRVGKMSAFTQLHVARRLAPMLGAIAKLKDKDPERDKEILLEGLGEALSALRDEDVEYVINACLEAAERKIEGGGWAKVRLGGTTMYELGLPAMLRIAYQVITHNLSGFFAGMPSLSGLEGLMSKSPG